MTLKARVIPCVDVNDGRSALPAAMCPAFAGPRGQAKLKTTRQTGDKNA